MDPAINHMRPTVSNNYRHAIQVNIDRLQVGEVGLDKEILRHQVRGLE